MLLGGFGSPPCRPYAVERLQRLDDSVERDGVEAEALLGRFDEQRAD